MVLAGLFVDADGKKVITVKEGLRSFLK